MGGGGSWEDGRNVEKLVLSLVYVEKPEKSVLNIFITGLKFVILITTVFYIHYITYTSMQ